MLCLLPLAACSAEKEGPKAPPDPLATDTGFCAEWAKAACNDTVVENCSGGLTDTDACIAAQNNFCMNAIPTGRYVSADAEACIDAVRDAYSDAQLTAEEAQTVLRLKNECAAVVSGSGQEGANCVSDLDCDTRSGFECIEQTDGSGACYAPSVQGGGYSCNEPQQVCEAGFYCDVAADVCRKRLDESQACSETELCLESLRCDAATCQPKTAIAQPCTSDEDCASGLCARGTSADGKCAAKIILSAAEPTCQNLS